MTTTDASPAAEEAIRLIESACGPADVFGGLSDPDASRRYRRLARLTHPDTQAGTAAVGPRSATAGRARGPDGRAARAFGRLAELRAQHQGAPGPLLSCGDIANFYPVGTGLLKLPRDPADNDLMDREAAALTRLHQNCDPRFRAYFPRLIQVQRVHDPRSGVQRRGNVVGALTGFRSLAEILTACPDGIDPRDAAWIWRRLLVAIGAAHRTGLIHGAVLPEHVLIHPAEHGLVLVDWCYSCGLPGAAPAGLPAIVGRYREWYPPEVLAREPAGPDTDIWLAIRCMTELMGRHQPAPLARFAAGCTLASARRRPLDAWRLLAELDELLERLYGPRTFRPFAIPA